MLKLCYTIYMAPILKLDLDDEEKELEFELDFQLSLTAEQRMEMMLKKSDEIKRMLIEHGHREPHKILKRK